MAPATRRTGIATVSLSGVLADKLTAIAGAGFDGIEIFDNDLIASPLSPKDVAARCADLGLQIDLFQPVRDVEGVAEQDFAAVEHRFATKLGVMQELGTSVVLACSNARPDAIDDLDLTAAQLHRLGDLAADHGVTIAYEALAWGRHVNRVAQSWEAVQRADHPAVTLAVDTFHMLAHGDGEEALREVPGHRIGFLQVADAPLLEMNLLEWSRHHRCFPGEGTLDVAGVVAAAIRAGYDGPLSLEVFSDVVREADPAVTAREAMRSLLFLEDQLSHLLEPTAAPVVPPPPGRLDAAFLEIAAPPGSDDVERLLASLGFGEGGHHRSKPVTLWSNGGAHVVVDRQAAPDRPEAAAFGVTTPAVAPVAVRAEALLWPTVDRVRGAGEAQLPGITSPSGIHVFVSAPPGEPDHWLDDFEPAPSAGPLLGLDHVGVAVAPDRINEEVSFLRTLFGLEPAVVEEFMEPRGRLLSRALRPAYGGLRVVLNVEDLGPGRCARSGINQVAFATEDVVATVAQLRAAGVAMMAVPGNYYVDLASRFDLEPGFLALLEEHDLLYDRTGEGELLHAYTHVLQPGFYVEVLERRGGYDGYGSANTHVRLASQSTSPGPRPGSDPR